MWLIVSYLSSHILHLLFCCVLSIFVLTLLLFMILFCAFIRRDSVTLLRFPFLIHIVSFREILLVCCLKYPYSCFSFRFYLLVIVVLWILVLFLISLPPRFFYVVFKSSYRYIDAIIILLLFEFFQSVLANEFEWEQVSGTLLSILTDLNNAVVWMVSTRPLISKSSSPGTNPLVTVPRASVRIDWYNRHFHVP